jgi:hypothetical protein
MSLVILTFPLTTGLPYWSPTTECWPSLADDRPLAAYAPLLTAKHRSPVRKRGNSRPRLPVAQSSSIHSTNVATPIPTPTQSVARP